MNSKLRAIGRKIADKGGDIISSYVMHSPSMDAMRGAAADKKRQAIRNRRERITNDKKMGY